MIFFSKRTNPTGQSSNSEACFSIMGLILAIGLIGGLSTLIYGLVKNNMAATIGGGVVLGVSVILSVIFAVIFVYCFKNNNVNSHVNARRAMPHRNHYGNNQQNHRAYGERISSNNIAIVSGNQKYDHHRAYRQSPSMGYDAREQSLAVQNMALGDSMNSNSGRNLAMTKSSTSLNRSNGSLPHQNQQTIVTTHMERNNYRR